MKFATSQRLRTSVACSSRMTPWRSVLQSQPTSGSGLKDGAASETSTVSWSRHTGSSPRLSNMPPSERSISRTSRSRSGSVVRAARQRRGLVLRVDDAECARDAGGGGHRLARASTGRGARDRRSLPTRRLPVSKTHWSRKRMSLARKTKRGFSGRSASFPRRGALRVGSRERSLCAPGMSQFRGWSRARAAPRADVLARRTPHRLGDPVVEARNRRARLDRARAEERRELRRDDAATRDGGEGVDPRQEAELVQPSQRPEVEERRAVAAAGAAECDALALLSRQG